MYREFCRFHFITRNKKQTFSLQQTAIFYLEQKTRKAKMEGDFDILGRPGGNRQPIQLQKIGSKWKCAIDIDSQFFKHQ